MAAQVVWLASYPKSGNTWLRILLVNWRADGSEPADINRLDDQDGSMLAREAFDHATLLESGLLLPSEIDGLRPAVFRALAGEAQDPRFLKVHDGYRRIPGGVPLFGGPEVRGALYVVRDPRDVASSLAAHFDLTLDRAIAFLDAPRSTLCPAGGRQLSQFPQPLFGWSRHVASWLDQADIPVHVVRYEDLRADTAAVFRGVLEFLGEPADPARLERAVRHSRFEELQRQEAGNGFRGRISQWPFFRRGRAGAWREDLTPEQARRIEAAHGVAMRRMGYPAPALPGSSNPRSNL